VGAGVRRAIVAEVALSLVLVVGAGLLARSYQRLQGEDRGFDARGVISFAVPFPDFQFSAPEQKAAFIRALLDRLRAIPGATAVGGTSTQTLRGDRGVGVQRRGAAGGRRTRLSPLHPGWSPGTRISACRSSPAASRRPRHTGAPRVVVVSRRWRTATGRRERHRQAGRGLGGVARSWLTVVGVAGTLKETHDGCCPTTTRGTCPVPVIAADLGRMTFTVRTRANPLSGIGGAPRSVMVADAATFDP
jgi:putative ABC transport system permease protein